MSLSKYKAKREFDKTPEPVGGAPTENVLRFVVQKHHASHLHYDFRLEMRNVLKSWAVPKGPSMDASVKRLAMMVEDHPWDYRQFEGIIPSGYGAGTVIVWDEGTYSPVDAKGSKKEQEKKLLHDLYAGSLNFILKGKKLKGEFNLVKTAARGENAWLLMKSKDRYASKADITAKDKSVLSGRTLDEVKADSDTVWKSGRAQKMKKKSPGKKANDNSFDLEAAIKKGKKMAMPKSISPMLCTLTKEPVYNDEFVYEVKWDGYRIIGYSNGKTVRLDSRSGLDYSAKYPPVVKALKDLKVKAVFDGEVVVLNDEGRPSFDALQKFNGHDDPIYYYIFDLLWVNGYDIKDLPLLDRKQILKAIIGENEVLKVSDHFEDGRALFKQMQDMDMEGIVAKQKESPYVEDERGTAWLKTPTTKRQEFVIGGWAESDKSRSFKSLLFGAYNKKGEFEWIGRSGGGYKEREMPAILKKLEQLETKASPFVNPVLDTKGAKIHYVKPKLVANFSFATWTTSGRIRKPATFLGFRNDKNPKQVVREIAAEPDKVEADIESETSAPKKAGKKKQTLQADSNWKEIDKIAIDAEENFDIGDCSVTINNIDREIWKGVTKAQLIQYYHDMAGYILPYIKDRPQSLHIKPANAHAPGFYIKDMEGREPDCADIFTDKRKHLKKGKRDIIDYLVCNNEATLLYMINLGCIDINPWTSTIHHPESLDYIIIDLDPSDEDFKKAIKAALACKKLFDKYKLKAFPKTSGKTGIHIYIPCKDFSFSEARILASQICADVHKSLPSITTTEVSVNSRGNRLYLDPNQNDYADTVAAPYSARPHKIPTVSTPLKWTEINEKLNPATFTIDRIASRVRKAGDIFQRVNDIKIKSWNTSLLRKQL